MCWQIVSELTLNLTWREETKKEKGEMNFCNEQLLFVDSLVFLSAFKINRHSTSDA